MHQFALLFFAAAAAIPAAAQPTPNYAGQLIAETLARHPEVVAITISASPPKQIANAVIASSVARTGTPAGPVQLAVLASGQSVQNLSADGAQLTSTMRLFDVAGETIGTLDIVHAHISATDFQSSLRQAEAVRNELRRKVINAANLADPVPYVTRPPSAPYAQQLVDQTMAAHPELLVVAMHVAGAEGDDYPIIASSIGRIGKKADEDDMRVIGSGKPATGAYGTNKSRYGIELPMYDANANLIGALSVGYAYGAGVDEQALLTQARKVEAELRARIPSLGRLYGPAI